MKSFVDTLVSFAIASQDSRIAAIAAKKAQADAKDRLSKNVLLQMEKRGILADLVKSSVPVESGGEVTWKLNGQSVYDRFHGEDYPELINEKSKSSRQSQFSQAVKWVVAKFFAYRIHAAIVTAGADVAWNPESRTDQASAFEAFAAMSKRLAEDGTISNPFGVGIMPVKATNTELRKRYSAANSAIDKEFERLMGVKTETPVADLIA